MSDFLKLVGENVRSYRKQKRLTQEELAEKTGLQNTYIGGIERGERNISLETLEKVAIGLDVSPMALLDFKLIGIENNDSLTKVNLLDIHHHLLQSRTDEEIKLVHKTIKDILLLLDVKKKT